MIKNEILKDWIKITYPLMDINNESDLLELDFNDLQKFADYDEERINAILHKIACDKDRFDFFNTDFNAECEPFVDNENKDYGNELNKIIALIKTKIIDNDIDIIEFSEYINKYK